MSPAVCRAARPAFAAAAFLLSCATAACAPPLMGARQPASVAPDPSAVVRAWRDALAEGRPEDAWEMLTVQARDGLDRQGFLSLYQRQRDALVRQADALVAAAEGTPATHRAEVRVGPGRPAGLIRVDGRWRLAASPTLDD